MMCQSSDCTRSMINFSCKSVLFLLLLKSDRSLESNIELYIAVTFRRI